MLADRIENKWTDAFCELFEKCAVKKGDTAANWDASWREWMRRAVKDYENVDQLPPRAPRGRGPQQSDDERRALLAETAERIMSGAASRPAR